MKQPKKPRNRRIRIWIVNGHYTAVDANGKMYQGPRATSGFPPPPKVAAELLEKASRG